MGTHLYRYSRVLRCVEINSSFYRAHLAATWAKWAGETPAEFRFSIKAPKTVTHEKKLRDVSSLLDGFLEQIKPMGEKVGPLLFQLPPSLGFEAAVAEEFFSLLRARYDGEVALEPRHASWFAEGADGLLKDFGVARVAADPAKGGPEAAEPGGFAGLRYYRLHGSPRTYYSNYDEEFLAGLADQVKKFRNAWVIFDNTALSHAYSNALRLQEMTGKL